MFIFYDVTLEFLDDDRFVANVLICMRIPVLICLLLMFCFTWFENRKLRHGRGLLSFVVLFITTIPPSNCYVVKFEALIIVGKGVKHRITENGTNLNLQL